LITELIPGRNLEADWPSLALEQQRALATHAGLLLARLHSVSLPYFGEIAGGNMIDPKATACPLPRTSTWFEYLRAKLDFHLRQAETLQIFTTAEVARFYAKFESHASSVAMVTEAKLVHVDFHFGNLLYRGNVIVGVVDFEWAFAGDPLYDYCQWLQPDEVCVGSRAPFLTGAGRGNNLEVSKNFTSEELGRIRLYQMIRNIELSIVAKLHFPEEEAKAFQSTTLAQL
jgi:Ser/Thr protein kinase RdoA (MazF antagonist)